MRSISDIIQEIEGVVCPLEQILKTMHAHENVKHESKIKVGNNLALLNLVREKYRNVYGNLKESPRQQ